MKAFFALVLGLASVAALALAPTAGEAAPECSFSLGFAAYHAAHAVTVGGCRDSEAHDGVGDGWQHTDNGYLVWRKAANAVTFYADLSYRQGATTSGRGFVDPPAPTPAPELHRCSVPDDPQWPCHVG